MDARVADLMTRWLVPAVVPSSWPLSTPINENLAAALVVDAPAGPRPLRQLQLDRWGMEVEQLLPIALDNLRRQASEDDWQILDPDAGTRALLGARGQVASRMLILDEVLGAPPLGGALIAVPTTDALLVQPLDQVSDLNRLADFIRASLEIAGHGEAPPLLPDQLLWTDGQVFECLQLQDDDGDFTLIPGPYLAQALSRLAAHWRGHAIYAA